MRETFDVDKFVIHKQVSEHNIAPAMSNNADLLGYYGYQEALWRTAVDNLKLQLDTRSSELELEVKRTAEKMTEATAKATVSVHEDIVTLKKSILVAKEQEMLFSNAYSTLDNRGKMLVALGNQKRIEMTNISNVDFHTTPLKQTTEDKLALRERFRNGIEA